MESPLVDPGHLSRSNIPDENWWERLTSRSPLWSSGSATYGGEHVRELFGEPSRDPRVTQRWNCLVEQIRLHLNATAGIRASATSHADAFTGAGGGVGSAHGLGAGGCGSGAGRDKGRSSWVLVGSLRESAQALALAPLPDDADICLAEAEDLLFARDRITCALADRVGRVHGAGQAKQHGHASTRSWLRTAGGMSVPGAGRLLTLAVELARLPRVREKFAAGDLAAGVVEAICMATAQLSDEHANLAEPILLELAGKAGAAEVAKAGRYLRAVLDPDGEERDEQADYGRRFLRVRPTKGGGLEGEFYLPREPAARLLTLLSLYAKPKAEGDDRPLRVRQADAFIAHLEEKIAAELLVLVTAESLPTDPGTDPATDPANDHPDDSEDTHPDDAEATADYALGDTGSTEDRDTDPGSTEAEAAAGAVAGAEAAADAAAESADLGAGPRDEKAGGPATGEDSASDEAEVTGLDRTDHTADTRSPGSERGTATVPRPRRAPEGGADCEDANLERAGGDIDDGDARDGGTDDHEVVVRAGATHSKHSSAWPADGGSAHPHTAHPRVASPHAARLPDPPPEDAAAHHAHAGHRPAGDCRHGQSTPESQGHGHGHEHRRHDEGGCGCEARCSCAPGTPGTAPGTAPGTLPGPLLGMLLGVVPGVLLATGQMLPVSSVHRLARTSTLVRLVMDAEGQVLDMGRKVRLATPAQRRAVYARYATCWIDGCPLPATMCQIDHADNWSNGGLTDLKLLGPACQFHNRDRYQHPDRYTRRKIGTDRWAFTYHPAHIRVRSPRHEPGT
ncbi:HNH endonuclease signature motif containing protein [Microbispora sp. NBRC 16548]|uniref:HNH endonuclease signature motif containing protein n=1 Tax=Microbispora sp. NBRC 16548 TaxID=3030994 RepID=UPI0024A08951|nr:HNH endonuclease signature motif containing protein [Microbispora sp. NBRC 16548]GLX05021.1 hypothetical protein Misp03_19480 [Microbispora sp. NBRC 16548]